MAFGTFEVLAGDFQKGSGHQYLNGKFIMKHPQQFFREEIDVLEVSELNIASEESVKKMSGTVGWGLAGGALLGPVGLLAGLLSGGRRNEVVFVCRFKDGRKFMARSSSKIYTEVSAALFK